MQIQLLADTAPQPWRNGGGVTRELLAWHHAAASTSAAAPVHWQLRVSVADIAQDGPFSAFPGIARWFVVLHGAGVELAFAEGAARLDTRSPPCQFDGGNAPLCKLLDGATQDLNLMLRRSAGQGGMQPALPGTPWHSTAPWRALFSTGPALLRTGDAAVTELPGAGLLWCEHSGGTPWLLSTLAPGARAWWLHFEPRPA